MTLLNREFTVRDRAGQACTRELTSLPELVEVLAAHFGIVLPEGAQIPFI